MKIAARIFTILSLIVALGTFISAIAISSICFHPTQEILDQLLKSQELSQAMLTMIGIGFGVLAFWAVVSFVLSIVDLVILAKPLKKKPIVTGVFSLLFVNIITGILMLCMNEDRKVVE